MNNELKPYEEYKPINLLWIDTIPSHWQIKRNKNVMKVRNDVVGDQHSKYTLLSLTLNGIIARDMLNAKGKFPKDFDTYQSVEKGNLVFCLFDIDETPRTVGLASLDGMITSAYTVLDTTDINEKYLYYYYLSLDNNKLLKPLYTGLRKVISTDTFLRTKQPIPSKYEQDKIVKYLDAQLTKISRFIKAKKNLIAVLKEQKQAVINESVTKGLNPNVKIKPSGIEWLGDIPEHWNVKRCKFLFFEVDERSDDGKEIHLSMSQKHGLVPNNELEERRLLSENYIGAKICKKDDLVLNRLKAHLGVFALSLQTGVISPDYTVLRPNEFIYPKFGEYALKSQACRGELCKRVKGIVMGFWRLYTDDFFNIVLPLPTYEEQKNIVDAIEDKLNAIDIIIRKAQQEIDLITEYHIRLISDVVTGRLDVRNVVVDDIVMKDIEPENLDEDAQGTEEIVDSQEGDA